jgi:hypothetical protein
MTTTKENVSEATEAKQTKPNRIKIDNKSPKAESNPWLNSIRFSGIFRKSVNTAY